MPIDARQQLAERQADLVAALARRQNPPTGFDAGRVRLAARTLVSKRRKSVARAWPMLADSLGDSFAISFDAYARSCSPPSGGPGADAHAFAHWLDLNGELPPEAVPAFLASRLRRGFPVGFRTRREGRRLLVAFRLPILGVRTVSLKWFR